MPGGFTEIGFLAFGGVKLAGYTAAGFLLRNLYRSLPREAAISVTGADSEIAEPALLASPATPFLFGIARTVVGIMAGVTFGTAMDSFGLAATPAFYFGLLPIRLAAWSLVIWPFFAKKQFKGWRLAKQSLVASFWSCLLDLPAILAAFVIPGGMWIC
jgi:hypothetical protein